MRSRITSLLAVLGGVTVLVLASNTVALATTGHALLVGQSNGSSHATTIARTTRGPALVLHTRSGQDAPLAVNGSGKVTHLNADRVDGLDSSVLRTHTRVFSVDPFEDEQAIEFELPLAPGGYLVTYSNFFIGVGSGGLQCFVQVFDSRSEVTTAYSSVVQPDGATWAPALTGAGVVTKTRAGHVVLRCDAQGNSRFSSDVGAPLQITATPTTIASTSRLHPAPESAARKHAG